MKKGFKFSRLLIFTMAVLSILTSSRNKHEDDIGKEVVMVAVIVIEIIKNTDLTRPYEVWWLWT